MTDYKQYKGFKEASLEDKAELIDARGIPRTESLFIEVIQPGSREKYTPLYSLKEYENKGYTSAYQVYISSIDETDAAMKLVGSMNHWRKLCKLKWFINGRPEHGFAGLASWREDMASRDQSIAKEVLLQQCAEGNVTAARALDKMAKEQEKTASSKTTKRASVKEEDQTIVDLVNRFE